MLKELKDSRLTEDASPSSCSASPDGAYKIVHQYVPTLDSQALPDKQHRPLQPLRKLQVVTQTLHIPPTDLAPDSPIPAPPPELEKLRKEVKKLREYARLSVQDRKVLIHKIGTLKDKVHETSVRKSASPLRSLALKDSAVQCNLVMENEQQLESSHWLGMVARLQQKLVNFGEAADLMKSQLEALVDILQPEALLQIADLNPSIGSTLANLSQSSHHLLLSVKKTLEDIRDSAAGSSYRYCSTFCQFDFHFVH